ncbi:MAG: right-handed parallel beta-helix repeat-containing protein [Phycisphaerae bacterium]|nr:right-handed parallel beta-helix repeat-containing protein [Phycisphaerae bacterium]
MGIDESPHFFDCNDNGLSDACDIATGTSEDDNGNGIPDECEPDAWYVDDDASNDPGPGDPTVSDPLEDGSLEHPFDAIQEAIDVAFHGQDVAVFDGTYTGMGNKNLDLDLKAITVRSQNGCPEACIIDCDGDGRAFLFHREMSDSVVEGFTITGGYAQRGSAIYCVSGSPTITSCMITGNTVYGVWLSGGGAGVYCYNSSPTIANCRIAENSALNSVGGGIRCSDNGSPTIINCAITQNIAEHGGGIFCYGSGPTITNYTITGNTATDYGGGINCYQYETSPTITNCTFTGNSAGIGGAVYCHYYSYTTITNCILWADAPDELCVSSSSSPVITYCDVQGGWPGVGNIDAAPCFVDPADDFHLLLASPCLDAGSNAAVPPDLTIDLDGKPRIIDGNSDGQAVVDMGAYERRTVEEPDQLHLAGPIPNQVPVGDTRARSTRWCRQTS